MFEELLSLIRAYPRIILHRHKNPDGDALGSQVGLARILKDAFPEKEILAVGDMTPRYAFILDGMTMSELPDEAFENALSIVLDTSAKSLISDTRYLLAASARLDHHIMGERITPLDIVDTAYESCCSLVTAFAIECALPVSSQAAKALYTGMVTDSGRFRYDSTTPGTLRRAAFLLEKGFDATAIYRSLYQDELSSLQLRARFTLKIQTTPHRVAYIYTPYEEALTYKADFFTLSRGMVNVMAEIRGIDTWVNFTETGESVLCEIRSNCHNINPIAVKYGGGGHQKASGTTLKDRNEAMCLLEDLNALAQTGE